LLLDDAFLQRLIPSPWRNHLYLKDLEAPDTPLAESEASASPLDEATLTTVSSFTSLRSAFVAVALTWIFYATAVPVIRMSWHEAPFPAKPIVALEPFRIANQYGLFAVMTPHRFEIEFQGSNDGEHWIAYPFRYKPQKLDERPRIYAPYQPRFDWNLWFASLGSWQQNPIVPRTEELLLENDQAVLGLFAGNPFPNAPPRVVRAVLWQYWFSTMEQKHTEGIWWQRQFLGSYAPTLTRLPNGRFGIVDDRTLGNPSQP
jgi:hypothetical protein